MRTSTSIFAKELPIVSYHDLGWFSTLDLNCGDSHIVIHLPKGTTLEQVTDMLRTLTVVTKQDDGLLTVAKV